MTGTAPGADRDWLAARFEEQRPHLRAVAYRMLGSMSEAEDAVQDAWVRLSRSDSTAVENLGGWLTTVVARLCLDMLRSRKARREDSSDAQLPEPIVVAPDDTDPEAQAILADTVGMAMLIVLDTLSPAERLAFVLHDTFGLPFEQIAPIVDRSVTATRQLASRARRRVRGAGPSGDVSQARQQELVHAFLAASRAGDFEALLRVLDPDVVVRADAGAATTIVGRSRVIRGREAVANQAMTFRHLASGARDAIVNGGPGFVVFAGDRPFAVVSITFRRGAISELDFILDPDRLARLDLGRFARPG